MNTTIRLDADHKFTKAKELLVELWDKRATLELHEIEIREYKDSRSIRANNFYWVAVITPAAEQLGYESTEDLHRLVCMELYGTKRVTWGGKEYDLPVRTTTTPKTMNAEEFALHIERASALLAGQGVALNMENWRA